MKNYPSDTPEGQCDFCGETGIEYIIFENDHFIVELCDLICLQLWSNLFRKMNKIN